MQRFKVYGLGPPSLCCEWRVGENLHDVWAQAKKNQCLRSGMGLPGCDSCVGGAWAGHNENRQHPLHPLTCDDGVSMNLSSVVGLQSIASLECDLVQRV